MHAPALRPKSAIEIVDTAFSIWRQNIGQMTIIGIAATVPVIAALALGLGSMMPGFGRTVDEARIAAMMPMILLVVVLVVLWVAVVDGAMTLAAGDAYHGRHVSAADALRGAVSKGGTLVLSNLLRMILLMVVATVGAIAVGASAAASGGLAVLLGIVVFVGVMLFFARMFATTNAVVFENSSATESVSRSMTLSKDSAWRIFGVIVLVYIVLMVAQFAVGMAVQLVVSFMLRSPVMASLIGNVIGALLYPFLSIALMVLYFDQRIRKEGYDLDVMSSGLPSDPVPVPPSPSSPAAPPGRIRLR
jgi:hypothetical protein